MPHNGGLKTGLIVYGVGDHGGGPTRRDLASIREMQAWPVFPKVSFGTFGEYFRRAETVRNRLPVVNQPLNAIFPGCYTTQSRIKRGNRRAEAALLDAEALTAVARAGNERMEPTARFDKAWENVLFTISTTFSPAPACRTAASMPWAFTRRRWPSRALPRNGPCAG